MNHAGAGRRLGRPVVGGVRVGFVEGGFLTPEPAALESLAESGDGPVVMVNLIRFREQATEPCEGMSGAEAYGRYSEEALPHLARVGARVLSAVACQEAVIGRGEREWDMTILVEYPSPAAFLEMVSDPGYLETHRFRAAALEDSRLIPSRALPAPGG